MTDRGVVFPGVSFHGEKAGNKTWTHSLSCPISTIRAVPLDRPVFVTGATIRRTYDVSPSTLREWADEGKVEAIRAHGGSGKRRYRLIDVAKLLGVEPIQEAETRRRICYARVSSAHQHADLDRQCADLKCTYPQHELIRDTGSGLNWKRQGLLTLLDAVCGGTVAEVVVAHRDRLTRIGVELLEWLFRRYDTGFVVLNHTAEERASEADELRDDLLAVATLFVARNNRRRSAANRKRRRDATAGQEDKDDEETNERQTKRRKSSKDPYLSQRTTSRPAPTVVRDGTLDIQPMPLPHPQGSNAAQQESTPSSIC